MRFTEQDIVRHPLVQLIIRAYEERGRRLASPRAARADEPPRSEPDPAGE